MFLRFAQSAALAHSDRLLTRPGDAKEVGQWMAAGEHAGPSRKNE